MLYVLCSLAPRLLPAFQHATLKSWEEFGDNTVCSSLVPRPYSQLFNVAHLKVGGKDRGAWGRAYYALNVCTIDVLSLYYYVCVA